MVVPLMVAILAMAGADAAVANELRLARPFGDHMVLPMQRPFDVWGTAEPGSGVAVSFAGRQLRTTADAMGNWRVPFAPLAAAAEGREMIVSSGRAKIVLSDLLVGIVWLCSGQSNMDFPLERAVGGREEAVAAARFPGIRLCNLSGLPTDARAYDAAAIARASGPHHFQGSWQRADHAAGVSAVAWWTARLVHETTGIPVGVVENAVGGSGAEAWLPQEVLAKRPDYQPLLADQWLDAETISPWARNRARLNLGNHPTANHPFRPGFLFESGVRPWAGFPFDAVLWYQGETNAEIHDDAWNERMIRDLVEGWRGALAQDRLPFYMVQLPRIGGSDPLRRHWPAFRAVQERAAGGLVDTHLIVTADLGWDSPDVHPPDKRPIAERLAAAILRTWASGMR